MSSEEQLLRAIRENPHDDDLRLIYADLQEERGKIKLAEFIRLGYQLANSLPEQWSRPLRGRWRELVQDVGRESLATLPKLSNVRWRFECGFPSVIIANHYKAFTTHAPTMLELAPIRSLDLRNLGSRTVRWLSNNCLLDNFSRIRLDGWGVRAEGTVLAGCPYLTKLQHLNLSKSHIGSVGIRTLIRSPWWPQLRYLDLSNAFLMNDDVHVAIEAMSNASTNIEVLSLAHNWIDHRAVTVLASSPMSSQMRALSLRAHTLTKDSEIQALIDSPYFTNLEYLTLEINNISSRAQEALVERFGKTVCDFVCHRRKVH
ncbi:MAG: TIGR02996 domain-containing protein [Gemmataceae bacterium]